MTKPALLHYQLAVQQHRDNFIVRTRADIENLRQYLQQAQAGDLAAQQEMLMRIHRTNGSGAMLGFAAVSSIARQIEALLRIDNARLTAQDWQSIASGLVQLPTALQTDAGP